MIARVRSRSALAVVVLLSMLMLGACASVDLAPPAEDARAKAMQPPSGKALVYIYRHETMGAAIKMNVMVNGKLLGQTASKTYFVVAVPPGPVNIASLAENTSELTVQASAGNKYFVWQEVKMGAWSARSALSEQGESRGMEGVTASKLIQYVEM
jgi:hypothetical protein